MTQITKKNLKWLRIMYFYTIIGAGGFGVAILVYPEYVISLFKMPAQDVVTYGLTGSVYLAFGVLSILGLIFPVKMSPLLLLQLLYKVIWLAGVVLPIFLEGQYPVHAILMGLIFLTYIIGDLIAIPFKYIFKKDQVQVVETVAGKKGE